MNQFCSGGPDWATDVHLIIPQTQARDPAVLNTWLPTFTDILSRWKREEHLGVSLDFNGTSCTVLAQSRLTLCGPVAHATSTHISKGEKCLAGTASLAQLYPYRRRGLDSGGPSLPLPLPTPPAHAPGCTNVKGSASAGQVHCIACLIKGQFAPYLLTLITSYLYMARNV